MKTLGNTQQLTGHKIDKLYFSARDFEAYLNSIVHDWSKTLALLVITLVPAFYFLDYFLMPSELLPRFGFYRLFSTLIAMAQYLVIKRTKPSRLSYLHGYLVSLNVGGIIALMTVDLGGFNSSYYAGLNLVIIGVNLLLPWHVIHSVHNSLITVSMYIVFNLVAGQQYDARILLNNLFFLCSTGIIAISINHVKYKLVKQEFSLLVELKKARDALWSEMELAKSIQTALLPQDKKIKGYEISAVTNTAKEVGGDYYDIIESPQGQDWITIGDVSSHGLGSGLVMMMAQTSIMTVISNNGGVLPSRVLNAVNRILLENISRLGSDHYMTLMAIRVDDSRLIFAGKHQDLIIYRAGDNRTEVVPTRGTWLGLTDEIEPYLYNDQVELARGDIVLLFTDGITEAMDEQGEMFGQKRLEQLLDRFADLPVGKLAGKIMERLGEFKVEQYDDMTLLVAKKVS